MTDRIQLDPGKSIQPSQQPKKAQPGHDQGFAQQLERAQGITFSNHAQKRLEMRNIQLGDTGIQRLTKAVEKAGKKGCKESLVLMDDMAFIVNIRDRLVVTAMDMEKRGEGVFTRIDSVVLADDEINE